MNIQKIGANYEDDDNYLAFIESLKDDVDRIVYIITKNNGDTAIGSNADDRRDLAFDLIKLQNFMYFLVNKQGQDDDE